MEGQRTAGSIMVTDVKTIDHKSSLKKALQLMLDNEIGDVIVVGEDSEKPIGIVTERDLMRLLALEKYSADLHVEEIMSTPLETVAPEDSIKRAFTLMDNRKLRRIPVVKDGELVGIVTSRNLINWILRSGRLKYQNDELSLEDLQRIFMEM